MPPAVGVLLPVMITGMSYSNAWIWAASALSCASNCSFVGAGGAVGGTYAASIASHSASSSAVNGIGPSAVMWCLGMMCPYELAKP